MDEVNKLAMKIVLFNNEIDDDMQQIKNMREILKCMPESLDLPNYTKPPPAKKSRRSKNDVVEKHIFNTSSFSGDYHLEKEQVLPDEDPFGIIKPMIWMGKDVTTFFDKLFHDRKEKKLTLITLARHMWGTRILSYAKFLPSGHSLQRYFIGDRDPSGYEIFNNIIKCWYIYNEMRQNVTKELFKKLNKYPEFVKWYRYQLCMVMQASRDCKRTKNIGPFQAYYYRLLSEGYMPRNDWTMDSERIPSAHYHEGYAFWDVQHPISPVVYALSTNDRVIYPYPKTAKPKLSSGKRGVSF